jgi:release factor glutamine methyltransferase
VNAALRSACDFLRACGIDRPEHDVKLLAAFAAGRPLRTALGDLPPDFDAKAEARFRRLVARRGEGREPAAYLVGTEEFMGLEIQVTPSVLIPRPSTESLVERAGRVGAFLEIGTGSGAVAVALAVRGASGTATDLSPRALEIARGNAQRHGVAGRITFVEADLFVDGRFDLVVSNPPYVTTAELETLPPEVKHEPRLALDGGTDGLDAIRRIVAGARARAPRLLLECAPHQAAVVRDLALRAGFPTVRISRDLDGFDRVVEAT